MAKFVDIGICSEVVKPGTVLMVGGFMGTGTPEFFIEELVKCGVKGLHLISSDTATPERGVGKMVVNKQFDSIIASHIGLNKETGRQLTSGETKVTLIPQGTFAERIRAAGTGIGGFYTPTGVGTLVEEGKETKVIDGVKYLLELPLKGDVALIRGTVVDKAGNVYQAKTTRNFSPLMALAAETVIVQANKVVEIGELDPHLVMIPGTLVDYVVDVSDIADQEEELYNGKKVEEHNGKKEGK